MVGLRLTLPLRVGLRLTLALRVSLALGLRLRLLLLLGRTVGLGLLIGTGPKEGGGVGRLVWDDSKLKEKKRLKCRIFLPQIVVISGITKN